MELKILPNQDLMERQKKVKRHVYSNDIEYDELDSKIKSLEYVLYADNKRLCTSSDRKVLKEVKKIIEKYEELKSVPIRTNDGLAE